MLKAYLTEVR